jgi:hypothetical protein
MTSIGVDIGWVGFGREGGLLPNVRIGVARVWWCRGSIFARLQELYNGLTCLRRDLRQFCEVASRSDEPPL